MEILAVKALSFTYPNCAKKAVDNVSFTVNEGDFIALCGATGCGKSTLLRLLKSEIAPLGEKSGEITVCGERQEEIGTGASARTVGFVMQRPEQQIVTDKVWHELAFGLENLGVKSAEIRRRVAEMSEYFGISGWFERPVAELSGGQKQLLNLASVMVMQPRLLILDEPTSQLDPIAASDFIATLKKLNEELGQTIIIAEHRLEEIIPVCDRLLVMDSGRVTLDSEPHSAAAGVDGRTLEFMPAPVRVYHALATPELPCPLTVREGSRYLRENFGNKTEAPPERERSRPKEAALEFDGVWLRYGKGSPDVLRGLSFDVRAGEIYCLLGSNGSGKSTALSAAARLIRPYSGRIRLFGERIESYRGLALYKNNLTLLPQDVQTVFLKNTVREELAECGGTDALPEEVRGMLLSREGILDSHPYDLSGGEQQLVALAKALASRPRVLLLDEPTKGVDPNAKNALAALLRELGRGGTAILAVTHDIEFAASAADRCGLLFRGEVVSEGTPEEFFDANSFYTTAVNRMARGIYRKVVTAEQLAELCRANGRSQADDSHP